MVTWPELHSLWIEFSVSLVFGDGLLLGILSFIVLGIFIMMTLIVMVKNIREWWKSWKVIFVIGEIAVFFYHLVCGVNFLMYAVMGNDLAGF